MEKNKIDVLGINIDNLTTKEALEKIDGFTKTKKPHQIVTVNAEFLVFAQHDSYLRAVMRSSALNLADSTGVLWGSKFFSMPLAKNKFFQWLQIGWQLKTTFLSILFWPSYIRSVIKEKISGSRFIWDIAGNAEKKGQSIFLLGGYLDTAKKVKEKLLVKFPRLKVVGTYAGTPDEKGIVEKINKLKPDILLVAFGPIIQEKWIATNLKNLQVAVAVGLGGTFDYIAGIKPFPPGFLRYIGLEWAFRLVTQPYRIKRIFTAVVRFPWYCVRFKILSTKPYRKSVVACIVNNDKEIFIGKTPKQKDETGNHHWMLPQGGVEEQEDKNKAVLREVYEELRLKNLKNLGHIENVNRYEWPLFYSLNKYQGKFKGQEQTLFFLRHLENENVEIDKEEFVDFRWVKIDDLMDWLHPIRHGIGKHVIKNFNKFIK
ncbi:MAG: hypothetical protein COT91_03630 [Candidatus Doudnabacteria bacterium CG10_big_fil_rev_8_21_14_0_10_41_10]|uniref:Nudix hydrolase domain-containing protein n=1 Tax=Candidatus Doudnabacteria bacterium CG10_big_fil_rev_8_21_14_0_10_41_10 TaxID=1974551 RepID=A0A2H0VD08_9BACT|nr:MAG: hypothetical protein COT91_03630 [Candidatus Doudnabacteria bacterium CG10_big_fil_rev_8_21_14_0_10_41_10]